MRKKLAALTVLPMLLLTGCNAPNLCEVNINETRVNVEVRNVSSSYTAYRTEYYTCYDYNNKPSTCTRQDPYQVDGGLDWREAGKYDNPDEGWTHWVGDAKRVDNLDQPYKLDVESDDMICDGRENHKARDGEIVAHNSYSKFYVRS